MSDISLSIAIDPTAAKAGRDQIVSYLGDISASYGKVLDAAKAAGQGFGASGSQTAGAGMDALTQSITRTRTAAAAFWTDSDAGAKKMMALNKAVDEYAAGLKRAEDAAKSSINNQRARALDDEAKAAKQAAEAENALATARANAEKTHAVSQSSFSGNVSGRNFANLRNEEARIRREIARDEAIWAEKQRQSAAQASGPSSQQVQDGLKAEIQRQTMLLRYGTEEEKKSAVQKLAMAKAQLELNAALKSGSITGAEHAAMLDRTGQSVAAFTAKAGAIRETFVLIREGVQGDFTRMAGSLSLMAQYTGLLTPAFIGMGAAAAALGVAIGGPLAHLAAMQQQAKELDAVLKAVGNTSGATGHSLQALASQTAASGMSSREDVMGSFKAIASSPTTRGLDETSIQRLTQAAAGYAAVTGQDLPRATAALITALQGGYTGMMKLAESFPLATAAELQSLETMARHGDKAGFLAKSVELMARKLATIPNEVASPTEKAFHAMGVAWDSFVEKISHSGIVIGALHDITAAAQGAAAMMGNPESQRAVNQALMKRGIAPEAGGGYLKVGVDYGTQYGPGIPGTQTANDNAPAPTAQDADVKRRQDLIRLAQEEAAAYRTLLGPALEKRLSDIQLERAALDDLTKSTDLAAQKQAANAVIDARASAQVSQNVEALRLQTVAQQRLTAAAGDYNKVLEATIANQMDQFRRQNLGAGPAAAAVAERYFRQQAEDKRLEEQRAYFTDLQTKIDDKQRQVDEALGRGSRLGSGTMDAETAILKGRKSGAINSDADEARARALFDQYNTEAVKLSRAQVAARYAPAEQYDQTIKQITDLRTHINDLGLSESQLKIVEQQLTQATVDANIRRLQSSRDGFDGMKGALMAYSQSATNMGSAMAQVTTRSLQSVEDALMSFSDSTKKPIDAVKDMVRSILNEFQRLMVIRPMLGQFAQMMGMSGGSFGTSGNPMAGSPYGGASGIMGGAGGMGMMGMSGGGITGWLSNGIGNLINYGSWSSPWDTAWLGDMSSSTAFGSGYDGLGLSGGQSFDAGALNFSADAGASGAASLFADLFHTGGVVGSVSSPRPADPSWFISAPKFHSGGTVGDLSLQPNEVPAILQQGEEVLTADDPRHVSNGGGAQLSTPAMAANSNVSGHTFNLHTHVDARGATDPSAVHAAATRAAEEVMAKHAPNLIRHATNQAVAKTADMTLRHGRYAKAIRGT